MITRTDLKSFATASPIAYQGPIACGPDKAMKITLRKPTQADFDFVVGPDPLKTDDSYARLVVVGMANEDGSRMFDYKDLHEVRQYQVEILKPIAEAVKKHCFDPLEIKSDDEKKS